MRPAAAASRGASGSQNLAALAAAESSRVAAENARNPERILKISTRRPWSDDDLVALKELLQKEAGSTSGGYRKIRRNNVTRRKAKRRHTTARTMKNLRYT